MATGNDNTKFNKLSYWEERYKEEEQREWLGGYESLKSLIEPLLRPNDQILILGCGNSSLGSDLYGNGFRHVTNVDYSSCVIEKMRGKCADMPEMEWLCRDILKPMGFEPNSFDVVIEKATLDSFLVGEKNPWRISQESKDLISSILEQVSEILKPNGIFLSITFAQPHFRLPLYAEVKYGWSIETKKFGTDFAYFLYIITKGMPLNMDQIQKYLYCIAKSEAPDEDVPVELPENSLSSIDLF